MRERLAIGESDLESALRAFMDLDPVRECVLLSTCNRTEAYAILSDSGKDDLLADFLAGWHGLNQNEFTRHLYTYREGAAADHLFSVAAGIDSMILGEPDIQRQVKQSLIAAQEARTAGALLNQLFQTALTAGKRARTETSIAEGAFSVGAAAVELATQIFGESLSGHNVLMVGAGKMSEVTGRHLQSRGAPNIVVVNRTFENAVHLAEQYGGVASPIEELPTALQRADIVVCSTSAATPVITRTLVKDAVRARHNRPLFLIDIAVPRDVESSVDELDNVYLYNIDHLQQLVAGARQARESEVLRAREICASLTLEYLQWCRALEVSPMIVAVRDRLESIRLAELSRLRSRLPGISDKDWRQVESALHAITNKIAHPATMAIRAAAEDDDGAQRLETIRAVFGLDEESSEKIPADDGTGFDRAAASSSSGALGDRGKLG